MEHVLETAVFDEIYFAECEAKLGVLDALFYECDKLENIMEFSENANEFQIVQESFTKPDKNEGTLKKVALAVPRFIYMLIKKIADAFKKAFGKKESFKNPENNEKLFELVMSLVQDQEVMKLVCGAIVGTAVTVKAFCKKRYKQVSTKVTTIVDEQRAMRQAKSNIRYEFSKFKSLARESIYDMFGIYVNEKNKTGLIMMTAVEALTVADNPKIGVGLYLSSIKQRVSQVCANSAKYKKRSVLDNELEKVMFEIDNNIVLLKQMIPDTVTPYDLTFEEYQEIMKKFTSKNFTQAIEDSMVFINNQIVTAYQTYENSSDAAEKKTEKFEKRADNKYCDEIERIIAERITFLEEWMVLLNNAINKAVDEFNKKITSNTKKNDPNIKMDDWTRDQWQKDKAAKDVIRNAAEEKAKQEEKEKEQDEKKDDNKKPEKKESDD
jgi:hypothetical protein